MIIVTLCKMRAMNLHKFSLVFEPRGKLDFDLKRLQYFITAFKLYSNLIVQAILDVLPKESNLEILINRINCSFVKQNISIFISDITYRKVVFFLMFEILDKKIKFE